FKEALQKGVRSLEIGRYGLGGDGKDPVTPPTRGEIEQRLATPNSQRIFYLRHALLDGMSMEAIYDLTRIDPWFLDQIRQIVLMEQKIAAAGKDISAALLRHAKS
ncbi:MAG: hypothetical protein J0651_05320, partial [Actinobacteria bacterium]|nr:hypothetical protein [Actinomycetota bacterium]